MEVSVMIKCDASQMVAVLGALKAEGVAESETKVRGSQAPDTPEDKPAPKKRGRKPKAELLKAVDDLEDDNEMGDDGLGLEDEDEGEAGPTKDDVIAALRACATKRGPDHARKVLQTSGQGAKSVHQLNEGYYTAVIRASLK